VVNWNMELILWRLPLGRPTTPHPRTLIVAINFMRRQPGYSTFGFDDATSLVTPHKAISKTISVNGSATNQYFICYLIACDVMKQYEFCIQ
jgi:hypothetical protein